MAEAVKPAVGDQKSTTAGETSGVVQEQIDQNRKLREKIRAHEAYAAKVKKAYNELSEMYNQLRDDYAKFVTKHNDVSKTLEDTRARQEEQIESLEASLEDMKKAREEAEEELRKELSARDVDLSAVRKELETASDLNEELKKKVEEVDQLKEDLDASRQRAEELEEEKAMQEAELRKAKDQLWSTLQDLKMFARRQEGDGANGLHDDEGEGTSEDADMQELVNRIRALRSAVRDKVEELGGQNVEKEVNQLLFEENVDELVNELVRVKIDLAESQTSRLQLQYELKTLKKQCTKVEDIEETEMTP